MTIHIKLKIVRMRNNYLLIYSSDISKYMSKNVRITKVISSLSELYLHINFVFSNKTVIDRNELEDEYIHHLQYIWDVFYELKNKDYDNKVLQYIIKF